MTNREFYTAILESPVADDLKDFASERIAKLDATNAKRQSKPSKRSVANEPIKMTLLANIGAGTTASDVAPKCEISVQKASALLRQMVADGQLTVEDVKMPKKGIVKFYKVVG